MSPPDELKPIDVREYVIKEQGRYFRGGRYDPFEAASMIALEAMLSGATDVRICRVDEWLCIQADIDWLAGKEGEIFLRLLPFLEGGPNGVTSEYFPMVFSRSVATAVRGSVRSLKGASLGPLNEMAGDWMRVVAFEI